MSNNQQSEISYSYNDEEVTDGIDIAFSAPHGFGAGRLGYGKSARCPNRKAAFGRKYSFGRKFKVNQH